MIYLMYKSAKFGLVLTVTYLQIYIYIYIYIYIRGHTKECINDAINKVSQVPRREAIVEKLEQNKIDRVPFVITYKPLLPNIPKLLQESQTILNASEKCSEVFKNTPLVNYRRGRNLNDMLCGKIIPQQRNTNQRNKYSRDDNNKNNKES